MMENYSFQPSESSRSSKSIPPLVQTQPLPTNEVQEEGWNISELLSILQRRIIVFLGISISLMLIVGLNLALNKKEAEYESSFQLLVEPVNEDSTGVNVVNEAEASSNSTLDYESQIQVLKSPELMGSVLRQLQSSYPKLTYDSLLKSLTVTRLGETKIIEVSYRSNQPNQTKTVLDKIAQEYLDYSREKRQTKLRQGIQFVEKQLPSLQARVDQLQQELQLFQQRYEFVDPETQVNLVVNQVRSLSEERQKLDQQLAQTRANLAVLQGRNGKTAALSSATLYQQLLGQVQQLDVQIATESTRLQDENPSIQTLKEKRESLLPLLSQEAQRVVDIKFAELTTQLQVLEAQNQELAKVEQAVNTRRKLWPVLAKQYTELQRKLQIATQSLNRFLSTRENLQIQISQRELGWQLINAAKLPEMPSFSSDTRRNLILGLGASIFMGIAASLLVEKLDSTYHNLNSLKERVKLPILGTIPLEKQLPRPKSGKLISSRVKHKALNPVTEDMRGLSVVEDEDYNNYSTKFLEALRVLHTNIQLLGADRQIRSLIISSATPGDGKSTIAFNLAQIATSMGQRVLLVDTDLRRPVVHKLSKLNNLWGLSNLISTNLPIERVTQKLPAMNQLSVITAGPIPPDPAKLLSSEKMKKLMAEFHNNFDLVIYDAPPMLGLADASLLAPHTDGFLLVVRMNKTPSLIVKQALEDIKISRANVLGIVANGHKSKSSAYNDYY